MMETKNKKEKWTMMETTNREKKWTMMTKGMRSQRRTIGLVKNHQMRDGAVKNGKIRNN